MDERMRKKEREGEWKRKGICNHLVRCIHNCMTALYLHCRLLSRSFASHNWTTTMKWKKDYRGLKFICILSYVCKLVSWNGDAINMLLYSMAVAVCCKCCETFAQDPRVKCHIEFHFFLCAHTHTLFDMRLNAFNANKTLKLNGRNGRSALYFVCIEVCLLISSIVWLWTICKSLLCHWNA